DLFGRGDGKPSSRLTVVHRLVQRLGLQRHGLGIGAVEAGVVVFAVHPKRDWHQPHIALRQEFNYSDCARSALAGLLAWRLRLVLVYAWMFRAVAKLGRSDRAQRNDDEHRNGLMARFAV